MIVLFILIIVHDFYENLELCLIYFLLKGVQCIIWEHETGTHLVLIGSLIISSGSEEDLQVYPGAE